MPICISNPLITMDLTRKQLTNVERPEGIHGPMNMFVSLGKYPSADMRVVVRPNFDTLYTTAFLDLASEPMIVSVPDTGGRYYLLPMLDMWTDVFASPGWRTTGTQAGTFLVTPPGWSGTLRVGYRANKDRRTAGLRCSPQDTSGLQNHSAVRMGQTGTAKARESRSVRRHENAAKGPGRRNARGKFFASVAELLKVNPPHITDQPIIAQLKRIGIEPGESFDLDKADPTVRKGLEGTPEPAAHQIFASRDRLPV